MYMCVSQILNASLDYKIFSWLNQIPWDPTHAKPEPSSEPLWWGRHAQLYHYTYWVGLLQIMMQVSKIMALIRGGSFSYMPIIEYEMINPM